MRTIVIAVEASLPETVIDQQATITIGTETYTGKVTALMTYASSVPPETTVKISGPGLKVVI